MGYITNWKGAGPVKLSWRPDSRFSKPRSRFLHNAGLSSCLQGPCTGWQTLLLYLKTKRGTVVAYSWPGGLTVRNNPNRSWQQLGKEGKSFQFSTCEDLLCFLPDTGEAGKREVHLLQNLDNCRVPCELLFEVCSWTAKFAKHKGTWESHHWSGQSPNLVRVVSYSHSLCTRHERMSPSFASWTNLFLNNLEKDSNYKERTWLQIH